MIDLHTVNTDPLHTFLEDAQSLFLVFSSDSILLNRDTEEMCVCLCVFQSEFRSSFS